MLFVLISIRNSYHEERRRVAYEAKELIASNETKNKLLSILAHDAGLGLVRCKNFIELQDGRIWCESKPGYGTSFFNTLNDCTVLKEKQVLQL